MKKKTAMMATSFVLFTGALTFALIPKKSHQFALTLRDEADKELAEQDLKKKYTITRDFSDFSVYTFESLHSLSEVKKSLQLFGDVDLIRTHQIKMLDFLKRLI